MSNIETYTPNNAPLPKTLDEAMRYSKAMADAGLIPASFRKQPANILIAQEIARTMGESAWTVMSELYVVHGTPAFSAKFMRSRIRQAGHKLRESFDETTGVARAIIIRKDDPDFEHVIEWDKGKAVAHGLWGKGHWQKNPALMLKNRAMSECMREACYEVMGGIAYTNDEVLDFKDDERRAYAERVQESVPSIQQQQQSERPQVDVDAGGHRTVAEVKADIEACTDLGKCRELWNECKAAGYVLLQQQVNARATELQNHPEHAADDVVSVDDIAEHLDADVVEPELMD